MTDSVIAPTAPTVPTGLTSSTGSSGSSSSSGASIPPMPAGRLLAVDAFRGLVMFLMMAEVVHLARIARIYPESEIWKWIAFHTSHVEWFGCSLHDLIQPGFSFLVGVALPFSLAGRLARGDSMMRATLHAAWRAGLLVMLGIFLRSMGRGQTNFTFEDTLTQIGLGYLPLFLLGLARQRWQWVALVVILAGYWGAFALYPVPEAGFNYAAVGVPVDWAHHGTGLAAHWNKNSNLAWAFDTWFLNLFPRQAPFTHNGGGYATLSFIPTLGTMILGLLAGGWLKGSRSGLWRTGVLLLAGAGCFGLAYAAEWYGICPIVKKIWTPAWTLWSGGWCFVILAGFYLLIDVPGWSGWSLPLRVIGMNSIAAYMIAHLFEGFIRSSFRTHLGKDIFGLFGKTWEPHFSGAVVLAVFCLILVWMYRRRIFLRI